MRRLRYPHQGFGRQFASVGVVGLALFAIGRATDFEVRPMSGAGAVPDRTIHVDPDTLYPWSYPIGDRMEYSADLGGSDSVADRCP